MLNKERPKEAGRDQEIYDILKYLIKFRNNFFKKNKLTKEQKEDMEMEIYMLAVKKYGQWDRTKNTKFLSYIYSSFGLTFSNFVITWLTGINVKRQDVVKHKKRTGEQISIILHGIENDLTGDMSLEVYDKIKEEKQSMETSWEREEIERIKCFGVDYE